MQRRRTPSLAWSTLTRPSLAVALAAAGLAPLACTKGQDQPATTGEAAPAKVELDLWAGVPPLELEAGDIATELRPKDGPKPPTGASQKEALPFAAPPPEGPPPPVTAEGPLKVLRYGPTGEQGLVDSVSVVFDQPMIPLGSVADLRKEHVPITIEPQPPGKFRWLGTEALAFEAEGRFPFSTTYTVTVPAGERSTIGGALAKEQRWTFTTPALAIESAIPGDLSEGHLLDTPLVLRFNQPIRRDALAAGVTLSGGGRKIALTAVPEAEWKGVKEAAWAIGQGADDRLLILKPRDKLTPNTRYTVTLPGGVFGEGPNPSKSQSLSFTTYPPLRLSTPTCYDWNCNPESGFSLEASTPLAPAELADKIRVTPPVEKLRITAAGSAITFTGDLIGETTYTVEVDAGIADIHGQTLAKPYKTTVRIRPLEPSLGLALTPRDPAVIERSAPATLPLRITGLDTVEVRSRSFPIDKLDDFMRRRWFGGERTWPEDVPSPTKSTVLSVGSSKRRVLRERLDLAPHLRQGEVLFLAMRSNEFRRWGYSDRYTMSQVVQVTDLGLTAAVDNDSGVVMVTSIERGEPLSGVDVHLTRYDGSKIWSGKTDARGVAEFSGISGVDTDHYVLASAAGDAAFLPLNQSVTGSWWSAYGSREPEPKAFFYNDRQPYKPGETVHVAGILRQEERGPEGSVALWRSDFEAKWTLTSPRGEEAATGQTKVSPLGTFSVDIPLTEDADLGDYGFNLEVSGGWFSSSTSFYHSIVVEAYRAPEFEVDVEREEAAPLRFGDTLKAAIRGRYLHGAPLVGGAVAYTLRRQESSFSPPGPENAGFNFGPTIGWPWGGRFGGYFEMFGGWAPEILVAQGAGALDERGTWPVEHVLKAIEKDIRTPDAKDPEPSQDPPRPTTYTLEAQVVDQNRQAIAGRSTYVVHPALAYAGVRADRTVYRAGEQARIEAVVVDLEGQRLAGRPLEIELLREETSRKAVEKDGVWTYEYKTEKVAAGGCKETSAAAPITCEVKLGEAGSYTVRALTSDAEGKRSLTTQTIYVHGEDAVVWDQDQKRVDLVADRRDYAPGDTATVLIRSPFDRARGLAVIERDGIVKHEVVEVVGGTATLQIKIPEAAIPNLHIGVVLVRGRVDVPGAPPDQDLGRPSQAAGVLELKVANDRKKIAIDLTPDRRELAPKDTLTLKIQTRDHTGAGAPAAMAVMVVDEGVLSLLGYQTPDPLAFFHHPREPGAQIADLRAYLLQREEAPPVGEAPPPPPPSPTVPLDGFAESEPMADKASLGLGLVGTGRGGGGMADTTASLEVAKAAPVGGATRHRGEEGKMGKPTSKNKSGLYAMKGPAQASALDANQAMAQAVSLREVFASTAYFNPEVKTDEKGEATVEIPMPENLTSFRIMAVAVDPNAADRFGSADTSVKVRKPIMLRPSLPRFANFGDRFEASVMVDNQTSSPAAIMVGTRGLGVTIAGEPQKTLEIAAGESKEVRFPMSVDEVGKLRLQFAALANEGRDATEVTIPVNLPVTRQAFADYGVTDGSIARLIKAPMDALPGFGGLELSLSSTALTGLEDAARYLISYDYECSEQTASRILPIFVLGAIFDGFAIEDAKDKGLRDALAKEGIARLLGRQNYDGGFRFWDTSARSWPYLTTWVTFALLEGKAAGYNVSQQALDNALEYLSRYVEYGETTPWGRYYDYTSHAFAVWLLSRENRGSELFDRVWRHKGDIPLYGHALLLSAAHKYGRTREAEALRTELMARVIEDAKNAHFVEGTSEDLRDGLNLLMHSSVQTDAIALMALLEVAPEDPLLPKVMAGIMAERDPRVGGRWPTTHANAWALLAANRYYTVVEKETPDYVARIWLDESYAGEQQFRGRSMTVTEHKIPMRRLQAAPEQTLTLAKEGPGKLYYRLGLRYAPATLKIGAEAQGFVVTRTYEAVAQGADKVDPDAVRLDADGSTWVIKAGTLVKVNLTVVLRDRANFVVVDDPLPAGLEGQNSRFDTTLRDVATTLGAGGGGYSYGYGRKPYGFNTWYSDWWFPYWTWDHTELRDDRLLLFADRLPAGIYTYSYLARATTIGEFQLPPIHAEGMYTPERFGHSASGMVRVVE